MTKQKPALVIIIGFLIWIGGQWLGAYMGWPSIFALALDFLVLLAFMWALYTLWKIMNQNQS